MLNEFVSVMFDIIQILTFLILRNDQSLEGLSKSSLSRISLALVNIIKSSRRSSFMVDLR